MMSRHTHIVRLFLIFIFCSCPLTTSVSFLTFFPASFIMTSPCWGETSSKEICEKEGTYLQFVNLNATGSATMIGGVRIQLQDISKVPQYLSKNKSIILQWGASFLVQHFLDTQCPAAENERITHEDFSISFSVASLSNKGCRLYPMGRNEGPLHYCVHPGLLQPAKLGMLADGSPDEAHVINVYVHLLDASKRRTAIIRKSKDDEKTQREAALNPKRQSSLGLLHRSSMLLQGGLTLLLCTTRKGTRSCPRERPP